MSRYTSLAVRFREDYPLACFLIALSAIAQMLEEPVYCLSALEQRAKPKTFSEASMLLSRSVAYFLAAVINPTLPSFAFAHFLSSCLCSSLHWYFWAGNLPSYVKSLEDIAPALDKDTKSYFEKRQLRRFYTFSFQGLFKQLLTEGERYVVTFFYILSLGQQGIWDTITALGAILPRFVFRPLEESFYLHFCNSSKKGNARADLPVILRLSVLLGLICVCLGLPQCWSMLYIYGGEKISGNQYVKSYAQSFYEGVKESRNGPLLLQLAFVNTFMCAVNGILEGYMFAVMSAEELSSHNYTLMVFSAVYLWLTMGLGRMYLAKGMVFAQILNMAMRIYHGLKFVARDSKEPLGRVLYEASPTGEVWLTLGGALGFGMASCWVILGGAMNLQWRIICHAVVGFLLLAMVLLSIVRYETQVRNLFMSTGAYKFILRKIEALVRPKRRNSEDSSPPQTPAEEKKDQ